MEDHISSWNHVSLSSLAVLIIPFDIYLFNIKYNIIGSFILILFHETIVCFIQQFILNRSAANFLSFLLFLVSFYCQSLIFSSSCSI